MKGTLNCYHAACLKMGLFKCPVPRWEDPAFGIEYQKGREQQQARNSEPYGAPDGGHACCSSTDAALLFCIEDFPGCMQIVKATELRCTEPQFVRSTAKEVLRTHTPAACQWMAPVEAEKARVPLSFPFCTKMWFFAGRMSGWTAWHEPTRCKGRQRGRVTWALPPTSQATSTFPCYAILFLMSHFPLSLLSRDAQNHCKKHGLPGAGELLGHWVPWDDHGEAQLRGKLCVLQGRCSN